MNTIGNPAASAPTVGNDIYGHPSASLKRTFDSAFLAKIEAAETLCAFSKSSIPNSFQQLNRASFSYRSNINNIGDSSTGSQKGLGPGTPVEERLRKKLKRPDFVRKCGLTTRLMDRARAQRHSVTPSKTLGDQNRARAHTVSFSDIREALIIGIKQRDLNELSTLISVLPYHHEGTESQRVIELFKALEVKLSDINRHEDPSENQELIQLSSALLKELNSCEGNLSVGKASINSSIGSKFDAHIIDKENTDTQRFCFTPNTKSAYSMIGKLKSISAPIVERDGVNRTPHIISSKYHGTQHKFSAKLFTPESKKLIYSKYQDKAFSSDLSK